VISVAVVVGGSLLTPAPTEEKLSGLTYSSITPEQAAENRASWGGAEVWATGVVLALVVGTYIYFSFWLG